MDPKESARLAAIIKTKPPTGSYPTTASHASGVGPGMARRATPARCRSRPRNSSWKASRLRGGGIQFHVRCFYLWDSLRRVTPA